MPSEIPHEHRSPAVRPDVSVILTDIIDETGSVRAVPSQGVRVHNLGFWAPGLAVLLLKIGVAFIFAYAALSMSLDPSPFVKWLPDFLTNANIAPADTILHVFGLYELGLVGWLLSGKGLFYSSLLAAITLSFIVLFNLKSFDVLFRNVAILFACLALAAMSRKPAT